MYVHMHISILKCDKSNVKMITILYMSYTVSHVVLIYDRGDIWSFI